MKKSAEKGSTGKLAAKESLSEGDELREKGMVAESIKSYQKAIQIKPDYILALLKLAEIYEEQENWAEAVKCYQKIIDFKPEEQSTYLKLAKALKRQNKIRDVIAVYQKAITLKPEQPAHVYASLAKALKNNNELNNAIIAYQKAIEISPDNRTFYIKQAKLYSKEGNWKRVIDNYYKALEINPDLPFDIYQRLGEALKVQGRREEKKIDIKPLLKRGNQLKKQGKLNEAILNCHNAIKNNPYSPYSYILLGDILEEKGDSKKANLYYRLAIYLLADIQENKNLEDIVEEVSNKRNVIITQISNNYFPLFEIWYSYFKKLSIENLIVIALDRIVYSKLIDLGLNTYLLPIFDYEDNSRHNLWFETVKVRKRIIDMDINYLHTDVDAFWLKNPFQLIESRLEDLVSTMGFVTPGHIIKQWGFAACFGFYRMNSNENTKKIYNDYLSYTKLLEHDQNAINQLLFENETSWKNTEKSSKKGICKRINLDIYIISNDLITRRPKRFLNKQLTKPYVFHPTLGRGSMKEKIKQLNKWGIYLQS